MMVSTTTTLPRAGTPAYAAYLAERERALGLLDDSPIEPEPAPAPDPEPEPSPEPMPAPAPAPILAAIPAIPPSEKRRAACSPQWPSCHPANRAHQGGYVWLADEGRWHCLWCVSIAAHAMWQDRAGREERAQIEQRHAAKRSATFPPG